MANIARSADCVHTEKQKPFLSFSAHSSYVPGGRMKMMAGREEAGLRRPNQHTLVATLLSWGQVLKIAVLQWTGYFFNRDEVGILTDETVNKFG